MHTDALLAMDRVAFDKARFQLVFDESMHRHILIERNTEEKYACDEGEWELEFDDDGAFLTSPTADGFRPDDVLEATVTQDPDDPNALWVTTDGVCKPLHEYQQEHTRIQIPLAFFGMPTPSSVQGCVLNHSVAGAFVLWNLQSLYSCVFSLIPDMVHASRWYENWWSHWEKRLTKANVDPPCHLRRSIPGKKAKQQDKRLRFLPWPSISTFALLFLLVRWSHVDTSGGSQKDAEMATGFSSLFDAIVRGYISDVECAAWPLYLDAKVDVRPGLPLKGPHRIIITMRQGVVDLAPLVEAHSEAVSLVLERMGRPQNVHAVPLTEVMQLLEKTGKVGLWLFRQFVYHLTNMIEGSLIDFAHRDDELDDSAGGAITDAIGETGDLLEEHRALEHTARCSRVSNEMAPTLDDSAGDALRTLQYYFSLRKHFHKARLLHLAVDAGQTGLKSRGIGFLTKPGSPGAWLPPLVVGSLLSGTTVALEVGSEEERKAVPTNWFEAAQAFWMENVEQGPAMPKSHRHKAWRWLCWTNRMLTIATGAGWSAFQLPDEKDRGDPLGWPSITLTVDQGSDGWCAAHFLMSIGVNVLLLCDTSHRAWNDMQLALKDSSMWVWCLVMIVVLNLDSGPWGTQEWFEKVKEAAKEYVRVAGSWCPCFQRLLPSILEEMKDPPDLNDDEAVEKLFKSTPEAVTSKISKVGMTRWFQYIDSMSAFLPIWSRRLLVLVYYCVSMGAISGRRFDVSAMKLKVKEELKEGDIPKAGVGLDREAIRKLRAGCKNTAVFCVVALMMRDLYYMNVIIVAVALPVRLWHSDQNKDNRSPKESAQWWVDRAKDKGLPHLREILNLMRDTTLLDKLHIHHAGNLPGCLDGYTHDDPRVLYQDDRMAKLGDTMVATVCRRARSCCVFDGYPGRFPALCDPDSRPSVGADMKKHAEDYDNIKTRTGAWWAKVLKRHPLRQPHNQQIFRSMIASDYEVSEKLNDLIWDQRAGVTQTKIVEDGVRQERVEEQRSNFSKAMGNLTAWLALINSGIENVKHRFKALPWRSQVVPKGMKDTRANNLFHLQPKETPTSYKKIMGPQATPPFYSPAPVLMCAPVEDLHLIRHLREIEQLDKAPDSWKSTLAGASPVRRRLLLRNPDVHGGIPFLSLGTGGGSCCLGVPLVEVVINGKKFFTKGPLDHYYWLPIVCWDSWQCAPLEWRCPLSFRLQTGEWPSTEHHFILQPTQEEDSLLRTSAKHGFWDLPLTALRRIARELGVNLDGIDEVPEIVLAIAQSPKALDKLLPEGQLEVLRHRIPIEDEALELLEQEEVRECLGKAEQDEIDSAKENVASKQTLVKKLRAIRKSIVEAAKEAVNAGKAAKGKGKGKGKKDKLAAAPVEASKKPRIYPPKCEEKGLAAEDINSYLPEGCKVRADTKDQSWICNIFGRRISRAWHLYTPDGAAFELIKEAWKNAVDLGFEPGCPFEEFKIT